MGSIILTKVKTIKLYFFYCRFLFLLSDGRLAACDSTKNIRIYKLTDNYICDFVLKTEHTDNVNYICQLENGKLVTCSKDKSIKIWNISEKTYQNEHIIDKAHDEEINKIITLTKNRMASCSRDLTIKIWSDNYPYNLIQVLNRHSHSVTSIIQLKHKEMVVSSTSLTDIYIWNLSTYQNITVIKDAGCYSNQSIIETKNKLVTIDMIYIRVINLEKYYVEKIIRAYNSCCLFDCLMLLRNGNLLFGNNYGEFYICDIIKGKMYLKKKKAHKKLICSLLSIDEYHFISASEDTKIKLWKY